METVGTAPFGDFWRVLVSFSDFSPEKWSCRGCFPQKPTQTDINRSWPRLAGEDPRAHNIYNSCDGSGADECGLRSARPAEDGGDEETVAWRRCRGGALHGRGCGRDDTER